MNKSKRMRIMVGLLVLILLATILVVGVNASLKRDSMYYAKAFLEKITTPEDEDSTALYRKVFSGKANQATFEDFGMSLEKDYGDLMSEDGYEKAVANRYIPWDILVKEDDHYKVAVDSYDVKKMSVYKDGSVHFAYLISLKVVYASGEDEAVQVSGDLVMTEADGTWVVDVFNWNPDYKGLYEKLLY